ncbi:MAG: magnesium transporter [Acutalibacteraceae bacterium]|nr:magnesium transporter [Acutalibacteraceae bacterium]
MEEKKEVFLPEEEAILENRDYTEEILAVIRSSFTDEEIGEKLEDYHDNDIADAFEFLSPEERDKLYEILGPEAVSDIFTYLDDVDTYIDELESDEAADIIESMDADDAVEVLDELEEEKRQEIIQLLDPEIKEDIELIDSYDEDEFGSRMTTNFIEINAFVTVKQAMRELIKQAADNDNISTIYTVDNDGRFYGAIELKELILARQNTELESLIVTSYPYVYANENISQTIEQLREYSEDSIPVLSPEDKTILGCITAQDIVDIMDTESGEDYARLAGLTGEEDEKETVFSSMLKRIPWLIVLLVLGLAVSTVAGFFEGVVKELAVIVAFQSLILGMAGNVGTQSLAVTIQGLGSENLTFKEQVRIATKELRIGFTSGLTLGVLSAVVIGFFIYFAKGYTLPLSFLTSGCVGLAMCIAMTVSGFTGSLIPLFFKKIGIDPAVASGPLITTVNDLVAVVIYYGLAWLLLLGTI